DVGGWCTLGAPASTNSLQKASTLVNRSIPRAAKLLTPKSSLRYKVHMTRRRMPQQTLPALLPFARVAAVALATLATMGVLAIADQPSGLAAAGSLSALVLLPLNIVTLLVLRRVVHAEGTTLRAMLGFDRARLGRDILWGLLWIMVLYVPFGGAIVGTMFALYGGDAFGSFETVFAPDVAALPQLGMVASIVFAVVVVLTFAPLNAPTEELLFRGYGQPRLPGALGIVLPSLAFALQHVFFASTA